MSEIKTQPRGVHAVMSVKESQSDSQAPLLIKEKENLAANRGKQTSLDDWSMDKVGEKMEEPLGSLREGMSKVSNRFKSAGGLFSGFGMSTKEEPKEKPKVAASKSLDIDSNTKESTCLSPPKISPSNSPQEPKKISDLKSPPQQDAQKTPTQPPSQPNLGVEKLPPKPPPRSPISSHLSLDSSTQSLKKTLKHSESLGSPSSVLSPTSPPSIPPPPLKLSPTISARPPVTPPTSPRRANQ